MGWLQAERLTAVNVGANLPLSPFGFVSQNIFHWTGWAATDGKPEMLSGEGLCATSSLCAEVASRWRTLCIITAPSCCSLLARRVLPQLQTSQTCCFHLSLSLLERNIPLQKVEQISPGIQWCPHPPMCTPPSGANVDLWACPTCPLTSLSPSHLATCCVQFPGAAGARVVVAQQSKLSMKQHIILAHHSPSPLFPLASFTHLTPVRLVQLLVPQLMARSLSLSFSWTVTSTSMKHSCFGNGEILESHFFSKCCWEEPVLSVFSSDSPSSSHLLCLSVSLKISIEFSRPCTLWVVRAVLIPPRHIWRGRWGAWLEEEESWEGDKNYSSRPAATMFCSWEWVWPGKEPLLVLTPGCSETYKVLYFWSPVCRQHSNGMDLDCADIHPTSVLVGTRKELQQDG